MYFVEVPNLLSTDNKRYLAYALSVVREYPDNPPKLAVSTYQFLNSIIPVLMSCRLYIPDLAPLSSISSSSFSGSSLSAGKSIPSTATPSSPSSASPVSNVPPECESFPTEELSKY